MSFNIDEHQHIRYNPLKGEWVLVSPHRLKRPWSGMTESTKSGDDVPEVDLKNPLCPGAARGNGEINPYYKSTYVFTNDFPALLDEVPDPPPSEDPLFQIASAKGTCRVMCFHPKSNMQIPTMCVPEIVNIIREWANQLIELGKKYTWVQIFENKGQMMGCSNPHPHCQIWCSNFLPNEAKIKDTHMREYYQKHGRPLLMDYVAREMEKKVRIVCENSEWLVVVPFWATWPFETMVLPKKQIERLSDLNQEQILALATIMKEICCKYDNIFECSFPYSMGWHGAPTGKHLKENNKHWTFHGLYYPCLLRSASIKKFMVGYELLAQSQRDLTPEKAAEIIREQPIAHYSMKK